MFTLREDVVSLGRVKLTVPKKSMSSPTPNRPSRRAAQQAEKKWNADIKVAAEDESSAASSEVEEEEEEEVPASRPH